MMVNNSNTSRCTSFFLFTAILLLLAALFGVTVNIVRVFWIADASPSRALPFSRCMCLCHWRGVDISTTSPIVVTLTFNTSLLRRHAIEMCLTAIITSESFVLGASLDPAKSVFGFGCCFVVNRSPPIKMRCTVSLTPATPVVATPREKALARLRKRSSLDQLKMLTAISIHILLFAHIATQINANMSWFVCILLLHIAIMSNAVPTSTTLNIHLTINDLAKPRILRSNLFTKSLVPSPRRVSHRSRLALSNASATGRFILFVVTLFSILSHTFLPTHILLG
mmetsp:Transcript_8158/g.18240  ORF Transcript_8158/g.18240 Transcript_8158/m.18240 type:complete len:282 (-) Transcript_8158:33-878(-)